MMGVVIINFFKCAQRIILLVCKVSLSFHISLLSYRVGALCAPPGIRTPKKPRGNRVKKELLAKTIITLNYFLKTLQYV